MKVLLYLFLFAVSSIQSNYTEPELSFSLIVFEGSDWCTNCIKFDKNILSNSEFQQFMQENNITLQRVDFPRWTKESEEDIQKKNDLAEQYNFQGDFPTLILTNANTSDYIQLTHHNRISIQELTGQIEKYFLSHSK